MNLKDLATTEQRERKLLDPNVRLLFSQFGEDIIVFSMLDTFNIPRHGGYYIDVGAHHPFYLSNTALFHQLGWSGINIDANPKSIELFEHARPRDKNIAAAVSDEPGLIEFVVFEASAISSADPVVVARTESEGRSPVSQRISMPTSRLCDLLESSVPTGQRIDLMSVDVEGYDLRVLRSNDWSRFAPFFLLVEDNSLSLHRGPSSAIFQFLQPLGYRLVSQAFITSIYVRGAVPTVGAAAPCDGLKA